MRTKDWRQPRRARLDTSAGRANLRLNLSRTHCWKSTILGANAAIRLHPGIEQKKAEIIFIK
jgi:hypothetical protein